MKVTEMKKKVNFVDVEKNVRKLADSAKTIEELKNGVEKVDGYLKIKELEGAENLVFGEEGNVNADILILGEAPGKTEDFEGRPFCGDSGELLNNMFKLLGINREELYITNTVFWRPNKNNTPSEKENRTPSKSEVKICKPFIEKLIFLIDPKLIITIGKTAFVSLINTTKKITEARGELFDYTNQYLNGKVIKTTPLFHPSYLIRNGIKLPRSGSL